MNLFGTNKKVVATYNIRDKGVKWEDFQHLKEAEYESNEYYRGFVNRHGELILVRTAYREKFHEAIK